MISKTKELVIHFPELFSLSFSLTIHINFNRKSNFVWFFIFFTLNVTPSLFIVYNPLSPFFSLSLLSHPSFYIPISFLLFLSFRFLSASYIILNCSASWSNSEWKSVLWFILRLTDFRSNAHAIHSFISPPSSGEWNLPRGRARENETKANVCSKHLTCWLKHSDSLSLSFYWTTAPTKSLADCVVWIFILFSLVSL